MAVPLIFPTQSILLFFRKETLFCGNNLSFVFLKSLDCFFLFFFSVLLFSLYLKRKNNLFKENLVIKYNFFPKMFTFLIKKELFLCKNPLFLFFLVAFLQLVFFYTLTLFKQETFFFPTVFLFLRSFVFIPYVFFTKGFEKSDLEGFVTLYKAFRKYTVFYNEAQEKHIKTLRTFFLFFSFLLTCLVYKLSFL